MYSLAILDSYYHLPKCFYKKYYVLKLNLYYKPLYTFGYNDN